MLKKITIAALLFLAVLVSPSAIPQEDTSSFIDAEVKTTCGDVKAILDFIHKKYREDIVFISDYEPDIKTQVAMFWNKRTKTYTIIRIMNVDIDKGTTKQMACVISVGKTDLDMRVFMDRLL